MAQEWPFFNRLLTDAQTALAIADLDIARNYSMLAGGLHSKFYPVIREEYEKSVALVLDIRQQDSLLENNRTLRRSIRLRNPYVDPMSLLQVELLRRWREQDRDNDELLDALLASVNGIARGLQAAG
jgi:phosphoenolpyruvate carboxylase